MNDKEHHIIIAEEDKKNGILSKIKWIDEAYRLKCIEQIEISHYKM